MPPRGGLAMTLDLDDDRVTGLSAGSKLVYLALREREEWSTMDDLVEETELAERTIHYSLNRLDSRGVLERRCDETDARKRLYKLCDRPP